MYLLYIFGPQVYTQMSSDRRECTSTIISVWYFADYYIGEKQNPLSCDSLFFPEKDYTINMPANIAMFSILIINIIFLTIECHHSGYNRLHAHFVWVSSLGCSAYRNSLTSSASCFRNLYVPMSNIM